MLEKLRLTRKNSIKITETMGCRSSFYSTLRMKHKILGTNSGFACRISVLKNNKYKNLNRFPSLFILHARHCQRSTSVSADISSLKPVSISRENVAQVQIFYETTVTEITIEQAAYSINDLGGKCKHFVF